MSMRRTVTICIPTYNYAAYLGNAIQSVLNQTFADWELIVVDNCSTDNTAEVVAPFINERVRYIRNETNLGMVGNWTRCLELAQGELIGLLHADDAYLPRLLEVAVTTLDAHPEVGYFYSAYRFMDAEGRPANLAQPFPVAHVWPGEREFQEHIRLPYVQCPTVILRRAAIEAVGPFATAPELGLADDWEMWLRIELAGWQVAYSPEPLALWRWHQGSLSREVDRRDDRIGEQVRVVEYVMRHLPPDRLHLRQLRAPAIYAVAQSALVTSFLAARQRDWRTARVYLQQALYTARPPGLPGFAAHLLRRAVRVAQRRWRRSA